MFDFLRDIYLETHGINSAAAEKIRNEKYETKRLNRYIFSNKMRVLVYILGLLYIVLAVSNIRLQKAADNYELLCIRYVGLVFIDIATCICLISGRRKGEIIALIGIVLFVLINFLTIM